MILSKGPIALPAIWHMALCAWIMLAIDPCNPNAAAASATADSQRSEARPETGFAIESKDGTAWLVRPGGERFFSLGVCCVDQGISRDKYNTNNPGYAAWRHYATPADWAQSTLGRLTNWSFTTIGGWSDFKTISESNARVAFAPVLHMGSTAGVPWWDMWDPAIIGRMEQVARDQIMALRDDPRLLGYYSDNEMGWWNIDLLHLTLKQSPSSGQRGRLLRLLREIYHDDWSELLADFEAEGATSFDELDRSGTLHLRPGGNGQKTLRRFLGLMADRYYWLVRDIIRKHDQRALILGDRYQSFYYPEVVRASAAYVDAVSSNLNTPWNDGSFPRYFLDTLHALTGRPVMVGEFYMAATENASGNKNSHGIFPVTSTQRERVAGFEKTILSLAGHPAVIGADWFQYYDEPTHGRSDGEDFNFGLVDIHNRPYSDLTRAAANLELATHRLKVRGTRADASLGVPRAPVAPLGSFETHLALKHWDRERGFVRPVSEFPLADLYVCWDEDAIYLGLCAQDIVETRAYRGELVAAVDRSEWVVSISGSSREIRTRIGAGMEPTITESSAKLANLSGVYHKTRNIAAMALPAALFQQQKFSAGDTVEFTSTYVGHGRADTVRWKGKFTLL
jgi:hypothetical protein